MAPDSTDVNAELRARLAQVIKVSTETIADLQQRLREQASATVSAAQTAMLAILRLEQQQPVLDAAVTWLVTNRLPSDHDPQYTKFLRALRQFVESEGSKS